MQTEHNHIISAVCHGADTVDRAVCYSILQHTLLYITAKDRVVGGSLDGFADGTADESHAHY